MMPSMKDAVEQEFDVVVAGEPLTQLPEDLYIPPGALKVFLETFQGPLDLLLYLIKKQNVDILDIPIVEVTRQYMEYVELMRELQLELAAEYLVMAAMLAEIKSRMLLPKPATEELEEGDPRVELIRRLQEYERYKEAAEDLDTLPRVDREIFVADATAPDMRLEQAQPDVKFEKILEALKDVMQRAKLFSAHQIEREVLSVREKMASMLDRLSAENFVEFHHFFTPEEGRMGVVVTFIAILELGRQFLIEVTQSGPFAPIYVKAKE